MNQLILIPTDIERQLIVAARQGVGEPPDDDIHLCGFGAIAAASRSAQLIAIYQPRQVVLVGIAGALSDRVSIGQAYDFASVNCDGIGVGSGEQFQSACTLGWPQWDDASGDSPRIEDRIEGLLSDGSHELLTLCAGSSTPAEADHRRRRFPNADAEDMEGFGVALSCSLAGVPLRIIRGISNFAGDRDKKNWKVKEAIAIATKRLLAT